MPAAPDSRRSRLVRGVATSALPPLPTLVVGVGGGVTGEEPGLQAMRTLATFCGARTDLRFADAGVLDAGLALDLEDGCDLIVIGEAKLGAPPCTVTLLAGAAADRLLAAPEYASPARTLCVLLHRLRQEGRLPARRAVLNVEPPPVALVHAPRAIAAAVSRAAAEALALVEAWRLLDRVTRPRALRAAGGPERRSRD
jgi:hypothetical protein